MNSNETRSQQNDLDTFDVRGAILRTLNTVLNNKLLILACTIFCVGLVWSYGKMFPPIYKAEVFVQAEPEEDKAREQFYGTWNTFRKSELSSEAELMKSTLVIQEVVEELNLSYDDVYHTHLKQITYLWSESAIGNGYRKIKHWIFPPEESPFTLTPEEIELSKTVSGFKDGAQLEPVPDSHVGYLVVRGPTPRVAEYANLMIDVFIQYRRNVYANEAETAYESLLTEVVRAEQERNVVMLEKLEFETRHGLAMGLSKDAAVLTNLVELFQMIQEVEFKLSSLESGLLVISEQVKNEPSVIPYPIRLEKLDFLFDMQKDLSSLRLVYKEDSPEIRNIKKRIADVEAMLLDTPRMIKSGVSQEGSEHYENMRARERELKVEISSTRAELKSMNVTRDELAVRVAEIPNLEREYLVHQRDQEMTLIKLRTLREKLMQADVSRITALSAPPSLRVVEYAGTPEKPYWPNNKLLFVVAVIFGFFGGVGLALLVETLNTRATHDNLLLRTNLPIYAMVEVTHRASALSRLMAKQGARGQHTPLALEKLKDIADVEPS